MLNRIFHTTKQAIALTTLAALMMLIGCGSGTSPLAPDLSDQNIGTLEGVDQTPQSLRTASGSALKSSVGEEGIDDGDDTDDSDDTDEDTGLSDEDLYQDPDFGDNGAQALPDEIG